MNPKKRNVINEFARDHPGWFLAIIIILCLLVALFLIIISQSLEYVGTHLV